MALSRMALDWSKATVSMKCSLSRSISLMSAMMRFSSSSLLGSTFFVTLASSRIGFSAGLFPAFFLPPIQISNIMHSVSFDLVIEGEVFQMKKCRQKVNGVKKAVPFLEELTNGSSIAAFSKLQLGQKKTITNLSFQNAALAHHFPGKTTKNNRKSTPARTQNQLQSKKTPSNSKSNRKRKQLELPLHREGLENCTGEESYREYYLVGSHFVGISSNDEQKLVQDFFAKTASTSYDFDYLNSLQQTKKERQQRTQLKKRTISSRKEQELQIEENEAKVEESTIGIRKQDKAVSNINVVKLYANASIEAIAECCEVGMQYSQRKLLVEQKQCDQQKTSESFKADRPSQSIQGNLGNTQQSLPDILFKIEFTHLIDDKSFSNLTQNQKEHFSQLLQTVLGKLSHKKQKHFQERLNTVLFEQPNQSQHQKAFKKCSNQRQTILQKAIPPQAMVHFQKLDELITRRQSIQKNIIQDNTHQSTAINTSLLAVLNFLGQFLSFIELQHSQEFIHMISTMYGLGFRQKYRRVTRNLPLHPSIQFRVIDEALFLDFINQSDINPLNSYEIAHFKAIFDSLNQHLEAYRPWYAGNGQQFPWVFNLFNNMSQYYIDEDSLQILFRQVKEQIALQVQSLCGLLVQYDEALPPKNSLELNRLQSENILIQAFVKEQNFEKDGIQLYATQTLHDISEQLWSQLIYQLAEDTAFLFT